MNTVLSLGFFLHDWASTFLAKHLVLVKRTLLLVAHLALFGFFFPDLRKDFGELAFNLLFVILFLSPLSKIFRTRLLLQLMGLRRELGIMMGYLATVHGLGYLLDPQWFALLVAPQLELGLLALDPGLLLGFVTYLLTLPLLLTSNALAQRTLGPKWKMLHRIVYGVFFFALVHRFLMKGGLTGDLIQTWAILGGYVFVKILAWKNFLTPLQKINAFVAGRYGAYVAAHKPASVPVESAPLS